MTHTFQSFFRLLLLLSAFVPSVVWTNKMDEADETVSSAGNLPKPMLIWWTPQVFPHWNTTESIISCKLGECISAMRSTLSNVRQEATGILTYVFYGTRLELEDLPLPRQAHHLWALLHEESPMNSYVLSHREMIELFNYTATFRRESDYPVTTIFLPNLEYLTNRQPVKLATKNRLRNSLAPIVYVQSHCDVASDRDRYVAELAKYITIDSYGSCLNNKSLPSHLTSTEEFQNEEFLNFIAQYKFHLAFENAVCKDYITEKLFRAWHVGSVPIYFGSPTVKDWSPSNPSVVVVNEFESPKVLAEYIIRIDSNDELYEKFLGFKKPHGFSNTFVLSQLESRDWGVLDHNKPDFIQGFECFICDRLIERQTFSEGDSSLYVASQKIANENHMGCPPPEPSISNLESIPDQEK